MLTRDIAILAGFFVAILALMITHQWLQSKIAQPVTEMSVTRSPLPALVTLVGRAGKIEIYSVKFSNSVFLVTSPVGEILKP